MTEEAENLIIKTLLYSDIFDFPLSQEETWSYLISEKRVNSNHLKNKIKKINSVVFRKNGFLHMEGKSSVVSKRIRKHKESEKKIAIANEAIKRLFVIPTVRFVGISGNLSVFNADKKDDIDIFVIVAKNRIWITRFLLIIILKLMGKYRKRGQKDFSNKFCLNMLIDKTTLKLPSKFQNLYTAHEVSQLMPIRQRKKTYKEFITANSWITNYLPNIKDEIKKRKIEDHRDGLFEKIISLFLSIPFLEFLAKVFQLHSINKNKTCETISNNFLAFHPRDYKSEILLKYNKSLSKYGLS